MSEPTAVRFYFDYISNNAYLAWVALKRLSEREGFLVEPRPVLFAGLLEAHGQLGPAEVPAKMRWMWRNTLRKAAELGIDLRPPVHHPFNPLLSLRVSLLPMTEEERGRLVGELFDAVWVHGQHISEASVVVRLADEIGLDGEALVAAAGEESSKALLRSRTEEAIAAGVFGVPTMIVDDELFWGFDDLPWLERRLAGKDPLAGRVLAEESRAPTASARRRRFRGPAS